MSGQQLAPARAQPFDVDILPENVLSEEVGSTIDKDPLFRPRIDEVTSPSQVGEETSIEIRGSSLRYYSYWKYRGVEVVIDDLSRSDAAV